MYFNRVIIILQDIYYVPNTSDTERNKKDVVHVKKKRKKLNVERLQIRI